jgi:hypothetical protein
VPALADRADHDHTQAGDPHEQAEAEEAPQQGDEAQQLTRPGGSHCGEGAGLSPVREEIRVDGCGQGVGVGAVCRRDVEAVADLLVAEQGLGHLTVDQRAVAQRIGRVRAAPLALTMA